MSAPATTKAVKEEINDVSDKMNTTVKETNESFAAAKVKLTNSAKETANKLDASFKETAKKVDEAVANSIKKL